MGRNTLTANELARQEEQKLNRFKRTLRRADQHLLEQLFVYVYKHTSAISAAEHLLGFETMLLVVSLEQQREIGLLRERLVIQQQALDQLKARLEDKG